MRESATKIDRPLTNMERLKFTNHIKSTTSKRRLHMGITKSSPVSRDFGALLRFRFNRPCSRIEVIQRLAAYIRYHKLEDSQNKRLIHPNEPLRHLLRSNDFHDESTTYFNLLRRLRHHFPDDYRDWASHIIQRTFRRWIKLQRVRRTIAAIRIQTAWLKVLYAPGGVGYHRLKRHFQKHQQSRKICRC